MPVELLRLYRSPALSTYKRDVLVAMARDLCSPSVKWIDSEFCYYIDTDEPLTNEEIMVLTWLLSETFQPQLFARESFLQRSGEDAEKGMNRIPALLIEVGPRMNFTTAWSTNAVSVCRACGISKVRRIERSRRFRIIGIADSSALRATISGFLEKVHDRMTECLYERPLLSFETGIFPETAHLVPLLDEGKPALAAISVKMGLGLDEWDIDFYYRLFAEELRRNPTNVECFDLSQSNSEHSRHWFFRGRLIIDGQEMRKDLMQIVKEPYRSNPGNSVIAFKDNSSAIKGFPLVALLPARPGAPSPFSEALVEYHLLFTAETHNFPSGVAPFPGAETGTGGRIRDVHATGRGSLVVAGTAAYCVGNLLIPGYPLPWEDASAVYAPNLAPPLRIEIEASNGASDYGNKFGEPVIQGFTRSFGLTLPGGERREWIKPIMFTGGIGQIDSRHLEKDTPVLGMLVVKVGGPAYRIGMGGGAASSMIQGENVSELDFNAVQRGDAEMEQKLNRVIRACVELGADNPICSIHDQGAGGNCNVVKEIIYPAGARIDVRRIPLGDESLSVLEIWGAEYQEQDAFLIQRSRLELFEGLCEREKVSCAVIGGITGDGRIVLFDEMGTTPHERTPVDLDLGKVLGEMPRKVFHLDHVPPRMEPLQLPGGLTVREALDRVLRLLSVGSKRFLTNKVDRSVTGLIARQQCVGPLQLTVSDVAVIAQGHLGLTGAAIAIGEQPVKGLVNPAAMARMSVAEAITNMVWAKISALGDIKCSANWMWAPKLPGEGAALVDAALAMSTLMIDLGIAVDGGKDSLSMAARITRPDGSHETVKSPGTLVISAYAPCPDITMIVTPEIKRPGESRLLYVDLGMGRCRLGGSSLAHCYGQVGDEVPDVEEPHLLRHAFAAIQDFIGQGLILAGHDRSDGGILITLLEMAFSGNCGIDIDLSPITPQANARVRTAFAGHGSSTDPLMAVLFAEEPGAVIEYLPEHEAAILKKFKDAEVPCSLIGRTLSEGIVVVRNGENAILREDTRVLRDIWEDTSHRIELLQANPACVKEEKASIYSRKGPRFRVPFSAQPTHEAVLRKERKPAVAILREEGSNGDREMASAFYMAGFEPWDVTMTDLLNGRVSLARFRGVAFVGGFSYADVLDSAKGWAGAIRFNPRLFDEFQKFYERADTFSLGVCNGCQLAALLGWTPWRGIPDHLQPRFIHNASGRFESRFSTVALLESPSIMLAGMHGAVLGVWVAHGEGRAYFPDPSVLDRVLALGLAPVRYVDDEGQTTETYPFNPNGSPLGIAALCTPDGRHLAMMPHPERTFLKWQWAWMPDDLGKELKASPWLTMFQNARRWCEETP